MLVARVLGWGRCWLESQEEVLECSNTGQDQVLESDANTPLLEWYPGYIPENYVVCVKSVHRGLHSRPDLPSPSAVGTHV